MRHYYRRERRIYSGHTGQPLTIVCNKGVAVVVPHKLQRFIRPDAPAEDLGELLTAAEAAEWLGVSLESVRAWVSAGRLIGWTNAEDELVIPAGQTAGSHGLVFGIDRVLGVIPHPRMAWRFLYEESPFLDRPERPIDVLKRGEIEDVLQAARASGEDFS